MGGHTHTPLSLYPGLMEWESSLDWGVRRVPCWRMPEGFGEEGRGCLHEKIQALSR